jgi:hypothetical protein
MFNFKAFLLDKFGSSKGLTSFLTAYGAPVPEQWAADKWFQRGTVPGPWLPVLLAYLEIDNGEPVQLAKYLGGGVPHA